MPEKRRQVSKFSIQLSPGVPGAVQLPRGAQVLSAQAAGVNYSIWALVDPGETATQEREFLVVKQDEEIFIDYKHLSLKFVNALQIGAVMLHFFELV